jgi:hypothetical protein
MFAAVAGTWRICFGMRPHLPAEYSPDSALDLEN